MHIAGPDVEGDPVSIGWYANWMNVDDYITEPGVYRLDTFDTPSENVDNYVFDFYNE